MESSPLAVFVAAHFTTRRGSALPFLELCPWRTERREYSRAVPWPTDLRWSRDGQRFVVCSEELVVASLTTERPESWHDTVVGAVGARLHTPAIARKRSGPFVRTADFGSGTRLFSGWSDGTVREHGTDARVDRATLARFDEPILMLRASPTGDSIAFATDHGIHRWSDGAVISRVRAPVRGQVLKVTGDVAEEGSAVSISPSIAWKNDGSAFAIAEAAGVFLHDARDARSDATVVDDHPADAVAMWGELLVTADASSVTVHRPDGERQVFGPLHPHEPLLTRCTSLAIAGSLAVAIFYAFSSAHLVVVDLASGAFLEVPGHHLPRLGLTAPVAFSPDGKVLAFAATTGSVTALAWDQARLAALDATRLELMLMQPQTLAREALDQLRTLDPSRLSAPLQERFERRKAELEATLRREQPAAVGHVPLARPEPVHRAADDDDEWVEGMRVKHATFGEGVVENVAEVGNEAKLTIRFAGGAKTLLAKFVTRS